MIMACYSQLIPLYADTGDGVAIPVNTGDVKSVEKNPSYSVIDEPWIPVVRQDGERHNLGLHDVLVQSTNLREIRDPLPIVEFGIYRLLAALILDMYEFGMDDLYSLGDILQAGEFDKSRIGSYFERYHERFDLFHRTHPFLQTPGMVAESECAIAALAHAIPSGSNQVHFHHRHERDFKVAPAAAARLLTTVSPFTTAGGRGYSPSINGAPPWYVLVCGDNLFQTLCFNTCVVHIPGATGDAAPAWRNDRLPTPGVRRGTTSLREALTWRPRRLQLVPGGRGVCSATGVESDITVSTMRYTAGDSCDFTSWRDPNVPYRVVDKKGVYALRAQEGKELWRDSAPLALLRDKDYNGDEPIRYTRPYIIDQLEEFVKSHTIPARTFLRLTAYALRTDQMKVFEWRRDELSLPFEVVLNGSLHIICQEQIEKADGAATILRIAIKRTFPRRGEGARAANECLVVCAQRQFWHELQHEHRLFLGALASSDSREARDAAIHDWETAVRRQAWQCLNEAIDHLDTDDEALKRWAEARGWFARQLTTLFMTNEEKLQAKNRRETKKVGKVGRSEQ
jgi:CRISPR system Cascade subunit CasA